MESLNTTSTINASITKLLSLNKRSFYLNFCNENTKNMLKIAQEFLHKVSNDLKLFDNEKQLPIVTFSKQNVTKLASELVTIEHSNKIFNVSQLFIEDEFLSLILSGHYLLLVVSSIYQTLPERLKLVVAEPKLDKNSMYLLRKQNIIYIENHYKYLKFIEDLCIASNNHSALVCFELSKYEPNQFFASNLQSENVKEFLPTILPSIFLLMALLGHETYQKNRGEISQNLTLLNKVEPLNFGVILTSFEDKKPVTVTSEAVNIEKDDSLKKVSPLKLQNLKKSSEDNSSLMEIQSLFQSCENLPQNKHFYTEKPELQNEETNLNKLLFHKSEVQSAKTYRDVNKSFENKKFLSSIHRNKSLSDDLWCLDKVKHLLETKNIKIKISNESEESKIGLNCFEQELTSNSTCTTGISESESSNMYLNNLFKVQKQENSVTNDETSLNPSLNHQIQCQNAQSQTKTSKKRSKKQKKKSGAVISKLKLNSTKSSRRRRSRKSKNMNNEAGNESSDSSDDSSDISDTSSDSLS